MKCDECQFMIEEYADAALDPRTADHVKEHLAACAGCAVFYEEFAREQEIYARYERKINVTPMLWSSIEARIKRERSEPVGLIARVRKIVAGAFVGPGFSPAFAAALVVIAVAVTVGVMTFLNPRDQRTLVAGNGNTGAPQAPAAGDNANRDVWPLPTTNPPESTIAGSNTPESQPTAPKKANAGQKLVPKHASPEQLVREAEQKYLAAIAMLSRDVNKNRSQLDPIMLARFDAALGDIDRTIKETRRVVRENPGDPIALQYLLAGYSKKVEVLREMTAGTEN
jgi:hypothetical protein